MNDRQQTRTHPSAPTTDTHPEHIADVLPLLAQPCPNCGAQPGQLCTTTAGGEPMRTQTHRARPRPRKQRTPAASRARTTEARGPAMSEDDLGREVAKLAKRGGWRINHHRRGRRGDGGWETATTIRGWPDLELFGPRIIWRELKGTGGRLSPDQAKVLAQLSAAGGDAACWWPEHLYSGEIERTLCGHLEAKPEPPSSR